MKGMGDETLAGCVLGLIRRVLEIKHWLSCVSMMEGLEALSPGLHKSV